MNWGGYLRAALRGLAQAVPVVGPMVDECAKHAEEERFQASVEALALRVARGERGRTQGLLRLTEEEVEQAVATAVRGLPGPDRDHLVAPLMQPSAGAPADQQAGPASSVRDALTRVLAGLSESPRVRHSLLTCVSARLEEGRPLEPGTRIDKYEVLELIGVGGMGMVYRARDLELDQDVVMKLLRPQLAGDPACVRRFLEEAKVGLELTHEGIVRVRDVRRHEGTPYLTMEWVEGGTLRGFLDARGKLTWTEAEPIARGSLRALAYAHGKGVLHLDVKPENVLLPRHDPASGPCQPASRSSGTASLLGPSPKLCDFGLARALARPGGLSMLPGAGTPDYMAPEQRAGGAVDKRADVYSAGVMLYEMLAGALPDRHSPTLREGFGVEEHISQAVEAALRRDPSLRPADAQAFLERLDAPLVEVVEPPRGRETVATAPEVVEPARHGKSSTAPRIVIPGLVFLRMNEKGYEEHRHEKMGMELIYVPPGEFEMGSDEGAEDEKPVHRVALDGYLIGKYEVTNGEYRAFCKATEHREPEQPLAGYGYAKYFADSRYDEYPVVCVNWEDAKAYCEWAGLRLPTEAEWEYAARGNDGRVYPWGNEEPDGTRANYAKQIGKGDYTRARGSYPAGASACGGLDMAGNVWEWCSDWYGEKYYANCRDGMRNPQGPGGGSSRVVRGGSWFVDVAYLRGAYRFWYEPGFRLFDYGFRVARSPAR